MKLRILLLTALSALILGCAGDSGITDEAGIRFINASPDTPEISVRLNNDIQFRSIGYGEESGFTSVDPGDLRIRINTPDGATPIIDANRSLSFNTQYSYFLYGLGSQRRGLLVEDDRIPPTGDFGAIRFGHLAPSAASVGVYLTFPDQAIDSLTPIVPTLARTAFSNYFEVPSGTYQVVIANRRTGEELLRTEDFTVDRSSISTILVLDSEGGGEPLLGARLIDR